MSITVIVMICIRRFGRSFWQHKPKNQTGWGFQTQVEFAQNLQHYDLPV
jgi:hypothetical protein